MEPGLSIVPSVIGSPSAALRINSAKQSPLALMRLLRTYGPRNDNQKTQPRVLTRLAFILARLGLDFQVNITALAPALADQPYVADDNAPVHALTHVVHS